jgi:hypothetical protein
MFRTPRDSDPISSGASPGERQSNGMRALASQNGVTLCGVLNVQLMVSGRDSESEVELRSNSELGFVEFSGLKGGVA